MKIEKQTVLKAAEGMILTNGETYGKVVYLGKNDSIGNWSEVDESESGIGIDGEPEFYD